MILPVRAHVVKVGDSVQGIPDRDILSGMQFLIRLSAIALLTIGFPGCGRSDGPASPGGSRLLTYTALGASDAVGIGAVPPGLGYVYDLSSRMSEAEFDVTLSNQGIIGAKADDIAAREVPGAIAVAPDVVTLWTGANDLVGGRSPDLFAGQLDQILAALRSRTRAQIFVGDLPDLAQAPRFEATPDPNVTGARQRAFNDRIRAVVAARGCVLVPLSTLPVEPEMFCSDGFHPSNFGHHRLAELFWTEIRPRL